ncbi:MAG: hypothetical protein QXR39_08505 [Candidatus Methanomethylicia archaeon]
MKSTANRIMLKIFLLVQNLIKNKFNLQSLKKLYNAHGESIIEVRIYYDKYLTDLIFQGYFKIGNDTIEKIDNPKKVDGRVDTDYQTILNIAKGEIRREYQGHVYTEPYSVLDAFSEGRLVITGITMSEYLGDLALFQHIYYETLPDLRKYINEVI